MAIKELIFNQDIYDLTRPASETVTIPEGTQIDLLSIGNSKALSSLGVVVAGRKVTLKVWERYKKYFGDVGSDGQAIYTAKKAYVVSGDLKDIGYSNRSVKFFGSVYAQDVSGGTSLL